MEKLNMSKKEWGIKRICPSCGIKYYDFNKSPIMCPDCNFEFDPDLLLKSRKGRGILNKIEEVNSDSKKSSTVENKEIDVLEDEETIIEQIDEEDNELSSEILDEEPVDSIGSEVVEGNEEIPFIEEDLSSVEDELPENEDNITIEIDDEEDKS